MKIKSYLPGLLILILCPVFAFAQVNTFPYVQSFEQSFISGQNIEFLPNWTANEVTNTNSKIFQLNTGVRTGSFALAAEPTSTFNGVVFLSLDASSLAAATVSFWARSETNGSGTRASLLLVSFSADGGTTYSTPQTIGNSTSFPNSTTSFQQYNFELPPSLAHIPNAKVKFEIKRSEVGSGTAARIVMDDFEIKATQPALMLAVVNASSKSSIIVRYNKPVEEASATQLSNYSLSGGVNVLQAVLDPQNQSIVHLTTSSLTSGSYTLTVSNILSANRESQLASAQASFSYTVALAFRDVVINEIFADPYPKGAEAPDPIVLPTNATDEFIELYNKSDKAINLANFKVSGSTVENYILEPGTYVILTSTAKKSLYSGFGPVAGISNWKNLTNTGGTVYFTESSSGRVIDSVAYADKWYQSAEKAKGGWSLEQINPYATCSGAQNWRASIDNKGATPGAKNSIYNDTPDSTSPTIQSVEILNQSQLRVYFNKLMDRTSLTTGTYLVHGATSVNVTGATPSPNITSVLLTLQQPLSSNQEYKISVKDVVDCGGNKIEENSIAFYFDNMPPQLLQIKPVGSSALLLVFNEALSKKSAEIAVNYTIIGVGKAAKASLNTSGKDILVEYLSPLTENQPYQLTVTNVTDLYNNFIIEEPHTFIFKAPKPAKLYDILITEIHADPDESTALPLTEWIELYNRSADTLNLYGYQLADKSRQGILPYYPLAPASYVILAPATNTKLLAPYGPVIGLSSWPALDNSGDIITLFTPQNKLIDQVAYTSSWYKNSTKALGGWSLERIDTNNPCIQEGNWTASENSAGGTPNTHNSVAASKPDLTGPGLLQAILHDSINLTLIFTEAIDTTILSKQNFLFNPANSVEMITPGFHTIRLQVQNPIKSSATITLKNVRDCSGNLIVKDQSKAEIILLSAPVKNDLLFSEIMYDPLSGSEEYIELYNNTNKYLNLNGWKICTPSKQVSISQEIRIVAPKSFVVLSRNTEAVLSFFPKSPLQAFITISGLPPLKNSGDALMVFSPTEVLIDSLFYSDDMHNELYSNTRGVALEKINYTTPSHASSNWSSASSTVNYGTPGLPNSQRISVGESGEEVWLSASIFTPNQDGFDDLLLIHYNFSHSNLMATIRILDDQGREVKTLKQNQAIGTQGFISWDGTNTRNEKAKTGYYIIHFETYNSLGIRKIFKKITAIAGNY